MNMRYRFLQAALVGLVFVAAALAADVRTPTQDGIVYGAADGQYVEAGIRLLELTRNMHRLFEKQQAAEKRRLLDFVVSNSVWREGRIVPVWRQPFDMIAVANESQQAH